MQFPAREYAEMLTPFRRLDVIQALRDAWEDDESSSSKKWAELKQAVKKKAQSRVGMIIL
jgi:hypothetical protein